MNDQVPAVVGGMAVAEYENYGDRFTAPLRQSAQFSEGISRHHRKSYEDYNVARAHILQALGDLTDLNLVGRQIAVAVFVRPNVMTIKMPNGSDGTIYIATKELKEDWYQHKAGLIIKVGPDAFSGDESYLRAMFGDKGAPKIGDWIFSNANAGLQVNLAGDGASRPQGVDRRGEPMDIFEWDGWPCRIMKDENIISWIDGSQMISFNPQGVV